ncbi:MAG: hypothetical protein FJZ87_00905 [Chloroflexi bacterium]|nr:hypothetical protein [Chloroflexota bacterium]
MKRADELRIHIALFLLSAATLTFEINLTRLFSVAQFYHFAFMIVSIALLGFGASGTALAIFPSLLLAQPSQRLTQLAAATGISMLAGFLLINHLPFDSFSIAWDSRQVVVLILQYLALALPFFFSGMALGFLLAVFPQAAGKTYAVNLLGSAAGCAIALAAPPLLGGEGLVTLSIALAASTVLFSSGGTRSFKQFPIVILILLFALACTDLGLRISGRPSFAFLDLRLSPYKSLSYALQQPGSTVIHRRWNAYSRVDVVRSSGIHSLPGLSYRYLGPLPEMDGLLWDGDDLNPIFQTSPEPSAMDHLTSAVVFHLRPGANTLVLQPRGGLDIWTALALGSKHVTAVEVNPLIVDAVPLYEDARVQVQVESDRSFLNRSSSQYDVILLSLISSYHPVRSGAYALAEDYRYTVEAFRKILERLTPDGLLVATRWLQDPPSEDLRLFALGVTALEEKAMDPHTHIVAFRGYNTATVLLKNGAFTLDEMSSMRAFLAARAFDLSYGPGVELQETNLYNILPVSKYHVAYEQLLEADPREEFFKDYEYDVRPPTDDHPFFGHYFKWVQAPRVVAEFGRAWQPFGGAGYFVIAALLILASLLASVLILLPLWWKRRRRNAAAYFPLRDLFYFGLLGLAFLFVEIPLVQKFILFLGNPAYSFTMVLFSLLFASGIGSRMSRRIRLPLSLGLLVLLILITPLMLPRLTDWALGWPLSARLGLTALVLFPLGFLMGIPFPAGIQRIGRGTDVAWVWAVNGAASVIASILSAMLTLSFGFNWVFRLGGLCYAGAWLTVWKSPRPRAAPRRHR